MFKHMKLSTLLAACVILIAACNNESDQPANADSTLATNNTPQPDVKPDTAAIPAPVNLQQDSVIVLQFAKDSNTVTATGQLNKAGDPVICELDIKQGKKLTGAVIPDKAKANIRFSHIVMPDGATDGPFGQTIDYKLKGHGTYKLYIAPNKMASDPFATSFKVRIRIE